MIIFVLLIGEGSHIQDYKESKASWEATLSEP